jgi:YVTN family beta-propeller protein
MWMRLPWLLLWLSISAIRARAFQASHYETPAGNRPPIRSRSNSILPGGRVIAPLGKQFKTGPGPFGLALSSAGKIATANLGPERLSMTVLQMDKKGVWLIHNFLNKRPARESGPDPDKDEWRSTFMGVAFAGEKQIWVSEGNSGRVRLIDAETGERRRLVDLNQESVRDTFAGDLAYDAAHGILYVTDQANFRVVAVDTRKGRVVSSVKVGRLPFAIALAPDGETAYVTNVGVFEYQPIPGASKSNARETGLPFPAFGFPSGDAAGGAMRQREAGEVKVPGLGDPNLRESNSVCILDVSNPAAMKVSDFVRTGRPFGPDAQGGSSPSGVLAAAGEIYISNAHNDSITVIDAKTRTVQAEIPIAVPGLEKLRGVMPLGMAFDAASGWLLVAEAGINAIGVIDVKTRTVLGHLPAGWFPTRVAIQDGSVYVTNAKGEGTGPNLPGREFYQDGTGLVDVLRRGTVSIYPLPSRTELDKLTQTVWHANGFLPSPGVPAKIPEAIKYVVLIVKENRTFDEVFGDLGTASNGPVAGIRQLARFGTSGYADGGGTRLSLQKVNVTPNHHAMAARWTVADNFYADSEVSVDGHHWLVGNYPDSWTETSLMSAYAGQKDFRLTAPGRLLFAESDSSVHPEEIQEGGTLWHHLERNHISFHNFGEGFELAGVVEDAGEKPTGARLLTNVPMPDPLYRNTSRTYPGFNMNIPDQYRADQLIAELNEKYLKTGQELPRFLFIHLPNDHMSPKPRPADGYPFTASFVADNDYALGRIVDYLSHSPWWREMAVFVTEDDAQGGRDHIDSHRTLLMGIGPYFRQNYAVHRNTSFPGLLKTIFRILGAPPLNLYDASAADLSEAFTDTPDFSSYAVQPADARLFVPANAKEPVDSKEPPVRMDRP